MSPEQHRANCFEKCLKQRIYLSDRIEKIEKVLVAMQIMHKEVNFCSQNDLLRFIEHFPTIKDNFVEKLLKDQEDVWFEIYRSVAQDK